MANLPETSTFDGGVYQIETTDLVLGGVAGPSNAGIRNLTNRTRWLFDQNTTNVANIAALASHAATIDGEITSLFSSISSINANLASINGQLPLLAPLASPSLSGNPTAPTQATGDNSGKIATTAFVKAQGYAPVVSPGFSGVPTAPTAATGTSTSQLATTAFVNPGASLTTNGYYKVASGHIEQYGQCNPAGSTITVTLPITFPNSFAVVVASSTGRPTQCNPVIISNSQFTISNTGGSSYWKATGW